MDLGEMAVSGSGVGVHLGEPGISSIRFSGTVTNAMARAARRGSPPYNGPPVVNFAANMGMGLVCGGAVAAYYSRWIPSVMLAVIGALIWAPAFLHNRAGSKRWERDYPIWRRSRICSKCCYRAVQEQFISFSLSGDPKTLPFSGPDRIHLTPYSPETGLNFFVLRTMRDAAKGYLERSTGERHVADERSKQLASGLEYFLRHSKDPTPEELDERKLPIKPQMRPM